jgi:hypothetical protein
MVVGAIEGARPSYQVWLQAAGMRGAGYRGLTLYDRFHILRRLLRGVLIVREQTQAQQRSL